MKRDPIFFIIISLIFIISIFQFSQFFINDFTKINMRRFHFKLEYPLYSVLQIIPAMYSYKNTYSLNHSHEHFINHHPTRIFYEPYALKDTVFINTIFQNDTLTSQWIINQDGTIKQK